VPNVEIELARGGKPATTLTGALGQSLRETRLTAMLGYLIALNSEPFQELFGFSGAALRVGLETRHDDGRSDILIETSKGVGVVEAKISATDPVMQVHRYPARWFALLTHRVPLGERAAKMKYVTWAQLGDVLRSLATSPSHRVRFLSGDLVTYLEEHRMLAKLEPVEIYAREINESISLALFLHAGLYGCDFKASSRVAEAQYFAPHFGWSIAQVQPGIAQGISYIARIETVGTASTWGEFRDLMITQRKRAWWQHHRALLGQLKKSWRWNKETHRNFLLLGKARLAFNPPVSKHGLTLSGGILTRHFFSFEELYAAWGK
jgi:hypothetical protein